MAVMAAGCGHPRPSPTVPAAGGGTPLLGDARAAIDEAQAVVALFVDAEARGADAADTLLMPGADFVMTGLKVTARPRLAGMNGPGTATIEEASTGLAGSFAWVVASYRFTARTPELGERARATFVLEKQRAGWKIRHVHSSMVARW